MSPKYVSVAEMIAVERAADQAGHSYQAMMEAAGLGLAGEIQERLGDSSGRRRIVGLVGSGNNGGDALVALDHLHGWGWETTAVLLKSRDERDPLNERYRETGGRILECTAPEPCRDLLRKEILAHDVVLDGVLGTGIQLPVRGDLAELLSAVKTLIETEAGAPLVVAVDCPSGVDCDTGEVDPVCIPADLTVTMAAYKHGLLKFPAYAYLGELTLVGIDLPPGLEALEAVPREVVDVSAVKSALPARPLDAHKGTFGTAVLVAGSGSYPGAALLAADGAYKVGAGLVQIGTIPAVRTALAGELPEVIWAPLEGQEGWISGDPAGRLVEALERAAALLIGPGLGHQPMTFTFLQDLLNGPGLPPLVVDADGLRLISRMEHWPELLPGDTVLTPHPGEMAVMTGWSVAEVQADRAAAAERFAGEWNHVVVLKGAHTVVASPEGQSRVIAVASPALAKAGTGDVLAGMITGLRAQGMSGFDAAWAAAWLHARAGEVAAEYLGGTASVLAGDVLEAVVDMLGWVENL